MGFLHSWVLLRDSFLVTLTVTLSPSEAQRREEAMQVPPGEMAPPESAASFRSSSVPSVEKSSWKVRPRFL